MATRKTVLTKTLFILIPVLCLLSCRYGNSQSISNADSFNGGFEKWKTLDSLPEGWRLTDRLFPGQWQIEQRPGETGTLERVTNSPGEEGRLGKYSLLLNGRIISHPMGGDLNGKVIEISLLARGKAGTLKVHLREYQGDGGTADRNIVDFATPIEEKTTDAWKEYVVSVGTRGGDESFRVDIEGRRVMLDNLKVSIRESSPRQPAPLVYTIPITTKRPTVDGVFSPEEWADSLGTGTGFMNINTASAVARQTEYAVTSDGEILFIAARIPQRPNGLKNTISQRDGNLWEDESLEVFINPYYDRKSFPEVYQFIVNTSGVVFDKIDKGAGKDDVSWDCRGLEVKAGQAPAKGSTPGFAILEIAVPLSSVGVKPGAVFGLNLARNICAPPENSTITGGGYKEYRSMARCVIVRGAPAIHWGYRGDIKEGKFLLEAEIANPAAKDGTFQVELGGGDKRKTETIHLAPYGRRTLVLDLRDAPIQMSTLSLNVTNAQGTAIFSQAIGVSTDNPLAAEEQNATPKSRVEFYPVQHKLNIRLLNLAARKKADGGKAYGKTDVEISRNGKVVLRTIVENLLAAGDAGHITVPFDPKETGTYAVRAIVHDIAGAVLESVTGSFEKEAAPWLGNSLGRDRVVIPPFTPMKTKESAVSCWGREYWYDGTGLPDKIFSQGEEILTAPMRLCFDDGTTVYNSRPERKLQFKEQAEDKVLFSGGCSFPNLKIKLAGAMEYDGLVRYEMDILPSSDVSVRKLSLEIPLGAVNYVHWTGGGRSANAWMMNLPEDENERDPQVPVWKSGSPLYLASSRGEPLTFYLPSGEGLVWSSQGVESPEIYGNFLPHLWLGNSRYGISWVADNDRGWINDPDHPCFELIRAGDTSTLRVNFISGPTILKLPRKIIFGIMATPARPKLAGGDQRFRVNSRWGGDYPFLNQHQGLTYYDSFLAKKARDYAKEAGLPTNIYIGSEFPVNDPATKYCWYEWEHEPFSLYTYGKDGLFPRRIYGPDVNNYISLTVCTCSSRIDYQMECLREDMEKGLIDGIYRDNTAPFACTDIQHERCGYIRDDGKIQGGYHLFETRELIKRFATMAYLHKTTPPYVIAHTTSAMVIPAFAFADLCFDGEWDYRGKDAVDFFTMPYFEVFGAGAWGGNQGWLPMGRLDRSFLAPLKLYDLTICPGGGGPQLSAVEKDFGTTEKDCRFVGYWQKSNAFTGLPARVKAGYYLRPGKGALIYLTNLSGEDKEVTPAINFASWDIRNPEIMDAETGDEIRTTKGAIKLSIKKHDFRVIRVDNATGSRLWTAEETNAETDLLGSARKWTADKEKVLSITEMNSFQSIPGRYLKLDFLNNGNGTEEYPTICRWFGPKKQGIDMRMYNKVKMRLYVTSDSPDAKERSMILVFMNRPKEGEKLQQQCCPEAKVPVGRWVDYTWDISKFDRDAITSIIPHFYEGRGNNLSVKEKYTWYVADFQLVSGESR